MPPTRWTVTFAIVYLLRAASGARLDESHFTFLKSPYNPVIEEFDDVLDTVKVSDVLNAAQFEPLGTTDWIEDTSYYVSGKGFRWSQSSPGDDKTEVWSPQGISTSWDTGFADGAVEGNNNIVLVSWNDQRNRTGGASQPGRGVRVSFVRKGTSDHNPENQAYIHALLVEPFMDDDDEPDFKELNNVVSGGLVWRGNWLYITDEDMGVRVFDLSHIWRVKTGAQEKIGKSAGDYFGGEYPFVIPQAHTYKTLNATFSPYALSLDRNSTPPCLMLAESVSDGETSIFVKLPLDDKTNLLKEDNTNKTITTADWAYSTNVNNVGGIVFAPGTGSGKYFIFSNDGDDVRGEVLVWNPGTLADEHNEVMPPGAQGAAYKPDGEEIWVLGSKPGERYVMAISANLRNDTGTQRSPTETDKDRTGTSSTPPTATITLNSKSGAEKLGPGKLAGIVVGVLLFALGIAAVGLFCFGRRKKALVQRRQPPSRSLEDTLDRNRPELPNGSAEKAELAWNEENIGVAAMYHASPVSPHGSQRSQHSQRAEVFEMGQSEQPTELPASTKSTYA